LAAVSACCKSELAICMLVTQYKANGDLQRQTVSLVTSNPWSGLVIWKSALKRSTWEGLEALAALQVKVSVSVPQSVTEAWLYRLRPSGVN
jgi:hypothetical protein